MFHKFFDFTTQVTKLKRDKHIRNKMPISAKFPAFQAHAPPSGVMSPPENSACTLHLAAFKGWKFKRSLGVTACQMFTFICCFWMASIPPRPRNKSRFHRTDAPDRQELTEPVHRISHSVARFLEREGILERDAGNIYLNLKGDEDPIQQVQGCPVSYRIAIGSQQGCKVFTLQTILSWEEGDRFTRVPKASGFSLHGGVAAQAWERSKLERLCRYITRPAVSEKRLSLTPSGNIRYQLKTPYNDVTTHVIFEPLDFIAKLAALVPKPRVNLTRFHGVFAPNSKHRVEVTPAKRGKGSRLLLGRSV
jgi:hypothetical protein